MSTADVAANLVLLFKVLDWVAFLFKATLLPPENTCTSYICNGDVVVAATLTF